MTKLRATTIIIGVGNESRGDDGAGTATARLLKSRITSDIAVLEQSGEGTALMDAWHGASRVILIDAVCSGVTPGTIHRVDAAATPLPRSIFPCSTHSFGLADAIEMARALHEVPTQVMVYGIEGASFDEGVPLSPAVEIAIRSVADQVQKQVQMADFEDPSSST